MYPNGSQTVDFYNSLAIALVIAKAYQQELSAKWSLKYANWG